VDDRNETAHPNGTFFTPANPLNLEARFGPRPLKTKKPHV